MRSMEKEEEVEYQTEIHMILRLYTYALKIDWEIGKHERHGHLLPRSHHHPSMHWNTIVYGLKELQSGDPISDSQRLTLE